MFFYILEFNATMGSVHSMNPQPMLSPSCLFYNHSTVKLYLFGKLYSNIRVDQDLVPILFAYGTWYLNSFFIFLMIMTSSQIGACREQRMA